MSKLNVSHKARQTRNAFEQPSACSAQSSSARAHESRSFTSSHGAATPRDLFDCKSSSRWEAFASGRGRGNLFSNEPGLAQRGTCEGNKELSFPSNRYADAEQLPGAKLAEAKAAFGFDDTSASDRENPLAPYGAPSAPERPGASAEDFSPYGDLSTRPNDARASSDCGSYTQQGAQNLADSMKHGGAGGAWQDGEVGAFVGMVLADIIFNCGDEEETSGGGMTGPTGTCEPGENGSASRPTEEGAPGEGQDAPVVQTARAGQPGAAISPQIRNKNTLVDPDETGRTCEPGSLVVADEPGRSNPYIYPSDDSDDASEGLTAPGGTVRPRADIVETLPDPTPDGAL